MVKIHAQPYKHITHANTPNSLSHTLPHWTAATQSTSSETVALIKQLVSKFSFTAKVISSYLVSFL